ncbi:MAG: MMPL family transporter [Myxococcota bacterium]|nr:MMPL family transporter [Myxococcota bacterium]
MIDLQIDAQGFASGAAAITALAIAFACLRPEAIVRHARWVFAVVAVVSALALLALIRFDPPGLTIDVDPASEPLINPADPGIAVYDRAILDFGHDDLYIVVMESQDTFARENLEALHRLTHRLRGLPGVASVQSLARVLSVEHDTATDTLRIRNLMDRVPRTDDAITSLRRRALEDPIYRKVLLSPDARATALNISFQPMTDGDFVERDLDGRIAALLSDETNATRRFYVAGRPHVRARAYHQMVGDIIRLIPVAVAVAALTMGFMTGSIFGVLIPLASCSMSTLWVFGAMASLGIDVNLITLVLGSLMICIGSVYGVHVYARFERLAGGDVPVDSPALACLRYTRMPVLMAGTTTGIGFAALLLADIPATNELGWFSILGVASVTLLSLTFVPAAMSKIPLPLRDRGRLRASRWFSARLEGWLTRFEHLALERTGSVLTAWGLATLFALAAIPSIAIDTDVITFFKANSDVRTDFAAVNRLITGAVPIYVMIDGHEEGTFREPMNLAHARRVQEQLEALPGVSAVLSSIDFVRLANRASHGDDPAFDRIPDTRAGVAEATFMLPKTELRRFANSNHSRINLIVRTGEAGSAAVRKLEAEIHRVLDDAELPAGFETRVSGNAVLLNRSADGIAENQATQVGFAAGAIFLLIWTVFRSPRVAAIAMVPNIAPVLIFFGLLGSGVARLSLPTSLIGSIALGIAIDDTMHFLAAYRAERDAGRNAREAASVCIRSVGRPIVLTSIMLVVGFAMILISGFATLQEFGVLTAFTMAVCLVTDLLLLPALLVKLDR